MHIDFSDFKLKLVSPTGQVLDLNPMQRTVSLCPEKTTETKRYGTGRIECKFKITTASRRTIIRLKQMAGMMKKPTTSYITLRRNCAKRNKLIN